MERWVYRILTSVLSRLYNNIQAAFERVKYEIIDDEDSTAERAQNSRAYSTGKIFEEYCRNLEEVIDEWILFRLRDGLAIPRIGGSIIKELEKEVLHD